MRHLPLGLTPSIMTLASALTLVLAIGNASAARANSLTLQSDASTLAATAPLGSPILDSGNVTGLTFQPVTVGAFGTFTPVPPGAPAGTAVVNIPPGDGESGFFEVTFNLPSSFSAISLVGEANVDDVGRAFLNGNPISPSITSGDPATLTEFGNATFSTANAAFFNPGTNVLLISDDNSGGGPSGAAFYATVTYSSVSTVPLPNAFLLGGCGLVALFASRLLKKIPT